jgi:MraZ protein
MLVGQGSHFEIWDLEKWNGELEALRSGGSPTPPPGMENFSL